MNKAVPWNINGVGFDAREAAREAARRQGKSLGEWLDGVIAEHAAEIGLDADDFGSREKIDAVKAKLERLGARASAAALGQDHDEFEDEDDRFVSRHRSSPNHSRPRAVQERSFQERSFQDRAAYDRGFQDRGFQDRGVHDRDRTVHDFEEARFGREQELKPRYRRNPRRDESLHDEVRPHDNRWTPRSRAPLGESDFLLEEAIEAMERRATAFERKSDRALASLAKMIETAEAKREDEQQIFKALSRKLAGIETRIAAKPSNDQELPIKSALARLEARLETLSRRAHREPAPTVPMPQAERVAETPRLRLDSAIADITRHQRRLDDGAFASPASTEKAEESGELRRLRADMAALEAKLAELSETRVAPAPDPVASAPSSVPLPGFEELAKEVADLSQPAAKAAPAERAHAIDEVVAAYLARTGALRDKSVLEALLQSMRGDAAPIAPIAPVPEKQPDTGLERVVQQLEALGTKIDTVMQQAASPRVEPPRVEPPRVELLPERPGDNIRAILQKPREPALFDKLERRLDALGSKIDQAVHEAASARENAEISQRQFDQVQRQLVAANDTAAREPGPETESLQALVRDLSERIEDVRSPDAGQGAIEALQGQIAELSKRFEQSDGELAVLPALERSMRAVFAQIEEAKRSFETVAGQAAHDAAAAVLAAEGKETPQAVQQIAALKAMQEQADQRAQATLNAVQETLGQVAERLSTMEGEMAHLRAPVRPKAKAPAATEARVEPKAVRASALPDLLLDPADALDQPLKPIRVERKAANAAASNPAPASQTASKPAAPNVAAPTIDADEYTGRADFIAAARRAARVAQDDPSVIALKRMGTSGPTSPTRADLKAKTRDYVETHKKPILMSLAALFVMIGTLAIVGSMQDESGLDKRLAATVTPPARVAQATPPRLPDMPARNVTPTANAPEVVATRLPDVPPHPQQMARAPDPVPNHVTAAELTPSAMPKAPAPLGSSLSGPDMTPTGSIAPSLPSFAMSAGQSAASVALRQSAEAGNAAAQYELASRYAEGRGFARDFATAVVWFEKAARQGLVPAEYKLASLYEKGAKDDRGTPTVTRDSAKARAWYTKAAEAGNPRAMHNLAVMVADGDGKPDYAAAVTWFRKAAEYGVHDSQYNLAILLARGLGAKQSLVQSYQWFAIAAQQNDVDAAKKRDEVGTKLTKEDIAVAAALADAFRPKMADTAVTEVEAPPGGWDSLKAPSPVKSEKSKLSAL